MTKSMSQEEQKVNEGFSTFDFNVMGNHVNVEHRKLVDWYGNDVTLIHTSKAIYRMVHANAAVPCMSKENGTIFAGRGVRVTFNIAYRVPLPKEASSEDGNIMAIKVGPASMDDKGVVSVYNQDGRLDHSLTNLLSGLLEDHASRHPDDMKDVKNRRWRVFVILALHLIDTNNLWARQNGGKKGSR